MAKKEHYPKKTDPDDLPLSTWAKGKDGTWTDAFGNKTTMAELFGEGGDEEVMDDIQWSNSGADMTTKPPGNDHYWDSSDKKWRKYGAYASQGAIVSGYTACRHEPTAVLAHNPKDLTDGWSLWAASRAKSDIAGLEVKKGVWQAADIAIGCDNQGWTLGGKHTIPKELPELLIEPTKAHIIKLDWPDRGAPPLPFNWWVRLYDLIEKNNWKCLLTCFGGHGRTGTALACLWAASGEKDPIPKVRKHYCKEAVESKAQEWYIEDLITWLDKQEEKGKEAV